MGHGDRLVIADGNFPAEPISPNTQIVRCDGHGVPELLDAILQVFPLDTYVEHPVTLMELMPGDNVETPIWDTYGEIIGKYDPRGKDAIGHIDASHSMMRPYRLCGDHHQRKSAVCQYHAAERRCDRLTERKKLSAEF